MSSNVASAAAELRIICGPTAAGKSGLAFRLAEAHGLEILSADSRQIYRRFDIGTAKPSAADRRRVTHHALDVAEPEERWSAARWAAGAAELIDRVGAHRVLVVGGTGLYLRALTTPLFQEPPLDPHRRAALGSQLRAMSLDELRRWTRALDPARAALGRTQLSRAIEVAVLTGRRLTEWHRDTDPAPSLRARWMVVDPGVALAGQIERRLDAMLADGWLEETRALASAVAESAPAWQACGYRTLREVALGARTLTSARDDILIATRQYAKRQRTWFRNQLPGTAGRVTRVDPTDRTCDEHVARWWHSGDPT